MFTYIKIDRIVLKSIDLCGDNGQKNANFAFEPQFLEKTGVRL